MKLLLWNWLPRNAEMRPRSVFKCPDRSRVFSPQWKMGCETHPRQFSSFWNQCRRRELRACMPPAKLPQLSVFFTEPRNVHKPQSRLILGCFLRMTWGICSGEEPKGPLVTHRRGSRGLLDKGDIWKVSINRFSKHHFFPPSQTQNFAWYFRKFVLSSANTRVNFTNSCFLKLREDTIFDHSLH